MTKVSSTNQRSPTVCRRGRAASASTRCEAAPTGTGLCAPELRLCWSAARPEIGASIAYRPNHWSMCTPLAYVDLMLLAAANQRNRDPRPIPSAPHSLFHNGERLSWAFAALNVCDNLSATSIATDGPRSRSNHECPGQGDKTCATVGDGEALPRQHRPRSKPLTSASVDSPLRTPSHTTDSGARSTARRSTCESGAPIQGATGAPSLFDPRPRPTISQGVHH